MSEWSLTTELLGLGHSESISTALRNLGVIQSGADTVALTTVHDWYRSGAESFLYVFDVHSSSGPVNRLVLKAYAPFFSAVDLSTKLHELVNRRQLLAVHGVFVPRLYAIKDAVVLEDFIPVSLSEWFSGAPPAPRRAMIAELWKIASVLDRLGFAPVSLYSDLRTDGTHPYMTDFGEDLGAPSARNDGYNRSKLVEWLANAQNNTF